MRGRKRDEKARANISKARLGKPSPRKGKTHTEEAKEKNRQAHLGKTPWNKGLKCPPHTAEHNAKIGAAVSGEKNPNYGKPSPFKGVPRSEETKQRIGNGNRGKKRTTRKSRRKRTDKHILAKPLGTKVKKAEKNLLNNAVILQQGLCTEVAVSGLFELADFVEHHCQNRERRAVSCCSLVADSQILTEVFQHEAGVEVAVKTFASDA